jgi:hypothetical protein
MNIPNSDVYQRISEPNEKRRLLIELARSRGDLIAKLPLADTDVFSLKAYDYTDPHLICPRQDDTPQKAFGRGDVFLSFMLGGEKYFFQGQFNVKRTIIYIEAAEAIFHLQRRDDYRLRIPESYQALFEITAINGNMKKISLPLADLSAGGCLLTTDPGRVQFKIGDKLEGHIFFPDRDPIQIQGAVRHSREIQKSRNDMTGIQFSNLSEIQKNRIASLVMDLYREFFLRHP